MGIPLLGLLGLSLQPSQALRREEGHPEIDSEEGRSQPGPHLDRCDDCQVDTMAESSRGATFRNLLHDASATPATRRTRVDHVDLFEDRSAVVVEPEVRAEGHAAQLGRLVVGRETGGAEDIEEGSFTVVPFGLASLSGGCHSLLRGRRIK